MNYSLDSRALNTYLDTQLTQGIIQLGGMNPAAVGSLHPSHNSKWAVAGPEENIPKAVRLNMGWWLMITT